MRSFRRTALRGAAVCALLAAAAALASTATGRNAPAAAAARSAQLTVGFSNPTGAAASLNATQAAVIALGKRLGFRVIALDAQLNTQKQVSDINQFIAQKVNGIIVFPLAPGTLNPALERAHKTGIEVLGWDAFNQRPAAKASIAPYDANFDQGLSYGGANKLARLVGQRLHGKGNVLGVGLAAPVPSIAFQLKQYQKDLRRYRQIKWLDTVENPTDDIAGGEKVVSNAVTRFKGGIDAVMSYNDASALGAAVALRHSGIENPVIVGEGGTPAGVAGVENGQITATVDIVPWRQGLIAATMMSKLLKHQAVPTWVENPVELYTKANIAKRLDWDTAVKRIRAGKLTCANGGCPASLR